VRRHRALCEHADRVARRFKRETRWCSLAGRLQHRADVALENNSPSGNITYAD
jgi:hypothetical protein